MESLLLLRDEELNTSILLAKPQHFHTAAPTAERAEKDAGLLDEAVLRLCCAPGSAQLCAQHCSATQPTRWD